MYKTSQKSKKTSATSKAQPGSFNVCGIEGFLLLFMSLAFSCVIFPILMSPNGSSKIETALARANFDLKGLAVSCGPPRGLERKCSVEDGEKTSEITVTASGDAFPASYYVHLDNAGKSRVRTDLRGEFLDLTTAQARLSNEVHSIIDQYLEREKTLKPNQDYWALTEAEKARNLASYE